MIFASSNDSKPTLLKKLSQISLRSKKAKDPGKFDLNKRNKMVTNPIATTIPGKALMHAPEPKRLSALSPRSDPQKLQRELIFIERFLADRIL
jgi:hypothetical protein